MKSLPHILDHLILVHVTIFPIFPGQVLNCLKCSGFGFIFRLFSYLKVMTER